MCLSAGVDNWDLVLRALRRARGCLPWFDPAQPIAQHCKSTFRKAKDSWQNPNYQRQESKN
jgi:hypothetical protein